MRNKKIYYLVIHSLLIALLILLGIINIPMPSGLYITFNMVPVAVAAIALGTISCAFIGGVWGIISFLQCFGILGYSSMGAQLVAISPFLAFIQRFLPRLLDGLILGLVFDAMKNVKHFPVKAYVLGFLAAFLNTLLFMTSLVLIFGSTDYMQNTMAGKGTLVYIVTAVGINGLVEMLFSTVLTGAIGTALNDAGLIERRLKTAFWRKES
jgi:uncharacterized membrane protein